MKIKELHIKKFGTIRNLDLNIRENINHIYGLNEAEKTTVVDFIIVMLYGTVNSYREDIREKYLPLDGSDMEGAIVFEHKDCEYLLERVFNAGRYKKDTIKLTNTTTSESEDLAYNIKPGEYLFNVNKETFWRNSYINESQAVSMMQNSHTKIMSTLLSNLISTASETTSVSGVANTLNSYCDPGDPDSISYTLAEKKEQLSVLKEELNEALKTENGKIEHQITCNELHSKFNHETKKYEKIKNGLEIQDMMNELDTLQNSGDNEHAFLSASDRYNEITSELKKSKILQHRRDFDKAYEKYKRIRSLEQELKSEIQKKTNLSVDLGRYTPKGDESALHNIISLQSELEATQETIRTLQIQLTEKEAERRQLKEKIQDAKENFEEAESALMRQEEMSRSKIAQAESVLHNSSHNIDVQPVAKSRNLIFAIAILAVLIILLIIFLTKPVAVIILGIAIFSDVYAIGVKIGKEKTVKNYSRVDENQLRASEISLRNLKNSSNAERDKFASKVAFCKNQLDDLRRSDSSLKKQLRSLENEISISDSKIQRLTEEKEQAEKNISSPDPKFYSIRSEINDIERNIAIREKNIEEIKNNIIADLSPVKSFGSFDDVKTFINRTITLLGEYDKLSEKLSELGDKDRSQMVKAKNQIRIDELNSLIAQASGDKKIKRLSEEEYNELKKMSQSLLEEISHIKDQYINAITTMKIQYNDSTCVANLETKISQLEREIHEIDEFIRIVKLSIDVYNEALYEIRENYAPSVARRTSEILSEITKGKYSSISIKGGKLVVKDREKNPVNFETISKSTCDQIYFALRLAVSEVTSGDMNYPIILDDIFPRFNETKSAQLLRFLINYAEKSQILVFGNTNQISEIAAQEQIPMDKIHMMPLS